VCNNVLCLCFRKVAERSEAKISFGLLSYFSLIWLHKTVPFFSSKEQRTQGSLFIFFLQKCEIDYFSQQICRQIIFLNENWRQVFFQRFFQRYISLSALYKIRPIDSDGQMMFRKHIQEIERRWMFNQPTDSKLGHPLSLSSSSLNIFFPPPLFFSRGGEAPYAPGLDPPLQSIYVDCDNTDLY